MRQPTKTLGPYVRMCSDGSDVVSRIGILLSMTTKSSPLESATTMDDVKNLIKRKDDIEEQIKAYYDVLEDVSLLLKTDFNDDAAESYS